MDKYLTLYMIVIFMDVKEEDTSEESKNNHISYYKSLVKIMQILQTR